MLRRIAAAAVGVALTAGLVVGIDAVGPFPLAVAVGAGLGAATFLVLDGSAGTRDGALYASARPRDQRVIDWLLTALAGTLFGGLLAANAIFLDLGRLPGAALVTVAALVAANLTFLWRRPAYEEALAEQESAE